MRQAVPVADDDEADPVPPAPGANKVEIQVGGHVVIVESAEPLADVVGYAMGIYQDTAAGAARIPMGFDTTGGQFERAEAWTEPTGWEDEPDDAR